MIKRKKKRILLITIITLVIALIALGCVLIVKNGKEAKNEQLIDSIDFSSKRLIITTDIELVENYNAKSMDKLYSGKYILRYDSEEDAKEAYRKFKKDSNIERVDVDTDIQLQAINNLTINQNVGGINMESWGVYTMGLDEIQEIINNKSEKEEVVVAVIDSGFDLNNPVLQSNNLINRIDQRYKNTANNSKDITDKYLEKDKETGENKIIGHGTHVGGIVLDGTPDNVKILPIKIQDDEGKMGLGYIYEGIRYAMDAEVDVINLSLGWEDDSNDVMTQEIEALINEATEEGIVVVAAVGNGDENGNRINGKYIYPAAYENVIGVAALKTDKIIFENNNIDADSYIEARESTKENLSYTTFSNYGKTVDYSAPGECILSIAPTDSVVSNFPIISGTSQASPHIAAAVATLKSYNKQWDTEQINTILKYYSIDLGTEGKDQDYGNGFVNFNNIEECTCDCESCDEIYCFGCACTECNYHEYEEPNEPNEPEGPEEPVRVLNGIEITEKPTKTTYVEGETFNKVGMVVTAVYSDGTKEPITKYTYTPAGELSLADRKVVIEYEGKTAEVAIVVKQLEVKKVLSKIEVTTNPNKTTYTEGEMFDKTGLVITAVYSDGTKQIVQNFNCFPVSTLTTNNDRITIVYTEEGNTVTTYISISVESAIKDNNSNNNTNNGQSGNTNNNENNSQNNNTNNNVNNVQNGNLNNNTNNNQNNNVNSNSNINNNILNGANNGNSNISTDNTIKDTDIVFTGAEDYVIPGIIIAILACIVTFVKYRENKEI